MIQQNNAPASFCSIYKENKLCLAVVLLDDHLISNRISESFVENDSHLH